MNNRIKAILFDSGRVLNVPTSGHWMIPPQFFKSVDKKEYFRISKKKRNQAFKKASMYIKKKSLIKTEAEEYEHFLEYYRIFFEELSELNLSEEDVEFVAKDLVYNYEKYTFLMKWNKFY